MLVRGGAWSIKPYYKHVLLFARIGASITGDVLVKTLRMEHT